MQCLYSGGKGGNARKRCLKHRESLFGRDTSERNSTGQQWQQLCEETLRVAARAQKWEIPLKGAVWEEEGGSFRVRGGRP